MFSIYGRSGNGDAVRSAGTMIEASQYLFSAVDYSLKSG
jgi:hypothetical protein